MEKIQVQKISQAAAAQALHAAGLVDPDNQFTPESLAASGVCVSVQLPGGQGVMVLEKRGAYLWVHATTWPKNGPGVVPVAIKALDEIAVDFAKKAGCTFIACEVARPGLARIYKKHGFTTKAEVLKKAVH